ncbi:MAG: BamA/TamA family outer membrane protein, partial [Acidobacteria bacterium]|nr:BamA/TamA family outer membrane protein [Acidobacteriota bacterium]
EVLTAMLQGEEGLQFVQVTYSERPPLDGSSGVDAIFDVVEGDTVRIENVYFEGATEFTQKELRWMTKKTGEHWLMSFLLKNDRYSPAGFEFDQQNLSNEYRRRGYIDIEIGTPEVEVYDIDRPWPRGDTRRLYVRIPINEGPQYRLGEVLIEGNTRFTDEQLASLVPLNQGDILDVKGLVDATTAMENIYSNFGYFQVVVAPIPVPDPATGIADVRYVITENALYTVRRIEFEGNTNTRDYVMRRNLRIGENDLWSQGRVEASKFKIQQLGYFAKIEEVVTIVEDPSRLALAPGQEFDPSQLQAGEAPQTGEVDITLKVSEVGRNQISFGGGVSALEGAFVQLGYATRNLFGRGQTFSFSGQFGGRTTTARLSFLQPYLFGKNIRGGIDIFRSRLDYIDFQQQSSGISFRVGFPLDRGEFTTLFLEYNFSNINIGELNTSFFGLSDPIFRALFLTAGERTTSSVRPNIIYNSINNPFNPSRGRRHTGSFEFAGGPLGGSLDFFKSIFTTTWYIPTRVNGRGVGATVSQIFAFNVQLRVVEPYGGLSTVPIFERFFLGGSNSVRGTQLRAIGPVDQFGNIIGGTRALQYNIEYIIALADPLRIAVFHDAGAAWENQFSLPDLRKTAGLEFRIFMPVFNVPFRFFWAYNFDPLARFGEERSSFEFAIGTTF